MNTYTTCQGNVRHVINDVTGVTGMTVEKQKEAQGLLPSLLSGSPDVWDVSLHCIQMHGLFRMLNMFKTRAYLKVSVSLYC